MAEYRLLLGFTPTFILETANLAAQLNCEASTLVSRNSRFGLPYTLFVLLTSLLKVLSSPRALDTFPCV